eukprot:g31936.t1
MASGGEKVGLKARPGGGIRVSLVDDPKYRGTTWGISGPDDVKVIWDDPEEMGAGTFGYYHTTLLAVHSYLKVTGAGGDEEGTEEAMELNGTYVMSGNSFIPEYHQYMGPGRITFDSEESRWLICHSQWGGSYDWYYAVESQNLDVPESGWTTENQSRGPCPTISKHELKEGQDVKLRKLHPDNFIPAEQYPGQRPLNLPYSSCPQLQGERLKGPSGKGLRPKKTQSSKTTLGDNTAKGVVSEKVDKLEAEALKVSECQAAWQVWIYNSFDLSEDGKEAGVIFLASAMMSHSCAPNAAWHLDENNSYILHARSPIEQEQEITISYLSPDELMLPSSLRRQLLESTKGFRCSCSRCLEPLDVARAFLCTCGAEALAHAEPGELPDGQWEELVCNSCGPRSDLARGLALEARLLPWARSFPDFSTLAKVRETAVSADLEVPSKLLFQAESLLGDRHWILDALRHAVATAEPQRAVELLSQRLEPSWSAMDAEAEVERPGALTSTNTVGSPRKLKKVRKKRAPAVSLDGRPETLHPEALDERLDQLLLVCGSAGLRGSADPLEQLIHGVRRSTDLGRSSSGSAKMKMKAAVWNVSTKSKEPQKQKNRLRNSREVQDFYMQRRIMEMKKTRKNPMGPPETFRDRLTDIMTNAMFEMGMMCLCLLSAVVVGIEVNWFAQNLSASSPPLAFTIINHTISVIFAMELAMKVYVLRFRFFFVDVGWHLLDMLVVGTGLVELAIAPWTRQAVGLVFTASSQDCWNSEPPKMLICLAKPQNS